MPSGVPNFQYKEHYSPKLQPFDRTNVNADDDEEIELEVNNGGERGMA